MATNITLPQFSESLTEATIIRWLKQEGDLIEQYEPLVLVETNKVTAEIPAPAAGSVLKVYAPEGVTVPIGQVIAVIGQPGEPVADEPPAHGSLGSGTLPETAAAPAVPQLAQQQEKEIDYRRLVTPAVSLLAAQHHIDLAQIVGTGKSGRVTRNDVLAYLETHATRQPETASDA